MAASGWIGKSMKHY